MKVIYLFVLLWVVAFASYSQNNYCNSALPFSTGTTYNFPAGVNAGIAESGPDYGCLLSQPNPAWYYMQVANSGSINIHISTNPSHDIDFVCWGPFVSSTEPCDSGLTSNCTSCPNNTVDSSFYPSGNLVDCSFSTSWQEDCHIPDALTGEFYILMITNYSNQECNIIFEQTNSNVANHGTTNYELLTGINNFDNRKTNIEAYASPNPLIDFTTLHFENSEKVPCSVLIYDITGKVVKAFMGVTTDAFMVSRDNLKDGIYYFEIIGSKTQRGKLIVQ